MSLVDDLQPMPLPESQPFWDGTEAEKLLIQRCDDCGRHYFPPAPVCPECTSRNVEWVEASGEAELYSYVITHRPWPQWGQDGPMSVALVQLAEGPRLVSTVVDCPQTPDALTLDMPLRATFRRFGEGKNLLCFVPAENASRSA